MQFPHLSNPKPSHGASTSDGQAAATVSEADLSDFARVFNPDAKHNLDHNLDGTAVEADQLEAALPEITATQLPDKFDPEGELPRVIADTIAVDRDPQSSEHSLGLATQSHVADSDQSEQLSASATSIGIGANRPRSYHPGAMVQSVVATFVTNGAHQSDIPMPQVGDLAKVPTTSGQHDALVHHQKPAPHAENSMLDAKNVRQPQNEQTDRFAQISTGRATLIDASFKSRQHPDVQLQNSAPKFDGLTPEGGTASIAKLMKADENFKYLQKPEIARTDTLSEQFVQRAATPQPVQPKAQTPQTITTGQPFDAEQIVRFSTEATPEITWDLRANGSSSSTVSQTLAARPEMPVQVAQQLAQAMHRAPDRPLEIALNPVELGRVRMTLTATEAGIVVNILAERPDTLDLMRRNIDDLGQSFSELGYEDIAFAFGQNNDPSDEPDNQQSNGNDILRIDLEDQGPAISAISNIPGLAINAQGVDLRL